jgi:hypothetical protein
MGAKMSPSYFVEPIGPETIDRAYPSARAVIPALARDEWWQYCRSHGVADGRPATRGEREEIVVARNAEGYVKGLCIYAVRDHATYGRLIDVPFFIASSAADSEGVTKELIDFLRGKCDQFVCSGIRFWTMDRETWEHRLRPDHIARSDHGLFLPALASTAGIMKAVRAHALSVNQAIDRLSR